jgi:hypothetical protein
MELVSSADSNFGHKYFSLLHSFYVEFWGKNTVRVPFFAFFLAPLKLHEW